MNRRRRRPPPESTATPSAPWRRQAGALRAAVLVTGLAALAGCSVAEPQSTADAGDADGMLGNWAVDLRGGDSITYTGTLEVLKSTGPGSYRGNLRLEFTANDGEQEAVEEDAYISVHGSQVAVTCRKPVVVTENGEYIPDNFYLTRHGSVMTGVEKDILSIGGTVTVTRK
jgi:hypothetical protein